MLSSALLFPLLLQLLPTEAQNNLTADYGSESQVKILNSNTLFDSFVDQAFQTLGDSVIEDPFFDATVHPVEWQCCMALNVSGTLWDITSFNIAKLRPSAVIPSSDLIDGFFNQYSNIANVSISGSYDLEGFVKNGSDQVSLGGSGTWSIVFWGFSEYRFGTDFNTTDAGFVDFDDKDVHTWMPLVHTDQELSESSFTDLINSGQLEPVLARKVRDELAYRLNSLMSDVLETVLRNTTVRYLKTVFSEKPLIDIILPKPDLNNIASKSRLSLPQPNLLHEMHSEHDRQPGEIKSDAAFSRFVNQTAWNFFKEIMPDPLITIAPIELAMRNPLFELHGTLWNISLSGFSNNVTDVYSYCRLPSQNKGWMLIDIDISGMTLQGQFDLSGSVAAAHPIVGEGEWKLSRVFYGSKYKLSVTVNETNGFLEMVDDGDTTSHFDFDSYPYTNSEDGFPGIVDETILGDEISYEIRVELRTQAIAAIKPVFTELITKHALSYFRQIYAETPLEDIIDAR